MTEKRALGKGLSALIPPSQTVFVETEKGDKVVNISAGSIKTSKYQPRVQFDEEKLNDLVKSIKEKGVIQPVLVRRSQDGYELIAGDRRLRAAKRLNLEKIPAIVKEVSDIDMLEISLIENIQREELNPIEEANAFHRLVSEFNFTQDKIAQVLGKDRSTISNTLRLLTLPRKIQDFVIKGSISAGHARALLSIPSENDQIRISNLIIKDGLSVREVESLAGRKKTIAKRQTAAREQGIVDLENQLQHILGTRVRIYKGAAKGYLQIEYYSTQDLNRILDIITSKKA